MLGGGDHTHPCSRSSVAQEGLMNLLKAEFSRLL